jgi:N-methylhydantoinase A
MEGAKGEIGTVEEFAAGILRVVETTMEKAIRVISLERGYDSRDFTLVAFGGGGPLHASSLARGLRIAQVMVPQHPGALSAVGILLADTVRDYSRTVMLGADANPESVFLELEERGHAEFRELGLEGSSLRSVDLRYQGQGYELNLPYGHNLLAEFHALHRHRYGFASEQRAVEMVNVRVRMISQAEAFNPPREALQDGDGGQALRASRPVYFDGHWRTTRIYERELLRPGDSFAGPAIVEEYSSSTVLTPGDRLRVDGLHNLILEVG